MIGLALASSLLVIVLDDLSRSDYEQVELPVLHRLQERSLYFPNAYSMPMCSPSRAATQFGEYGFRHGIGTILKTNDPVAPLPSDVLSLAEALRGGGLRTLHAGKWHLSTKVATPSYQLAPNNHGYDDALAWSHGNLATDVLGGVGGTGFYQWVRYDNGVGTIETTYATTAVVDATVEWWEREPGRKFAHVDLHAPHYPLHAPPAHLLPPGYPSATTDRETWESMLRAADTEIGRLLEAVDLEDTYVLVFSDNGTPKPVSADPSKAKGTVFEGGVNVPLFVAGPGVEAGRSRRLVHLVDVMATLVQLAGLSYRLDGDGLSFADAVAPALGPNPVRDWVFIDRFAPNSLDLSFPPLTMRQRAVRRADGYKLVVRTVAAGDQETLYLLPDEDHPVFQPVIQAQLRAILDGI